MRCIGCCCLFCSVFRCRQVAHGGTVWWYWKREYLRTYRCMYVHCCGWVFGWEACHLIGAYCRLLHSNSGAAIMDTASMRQRNSRHIVARWASAKLLSYFPKYSPSHKLVAQCSSFVLSLDSSLHLCSITIVSALSTINLNLSETRS